ncbi:MAG: CBS domain-containing protein [Alphaproteobacteria bacterium]|jgi:CBS domain-containing protein|nr:CBS domain-containing protein [Alphaproteobacteria bacterium]
MQRKIMPDIIKQQTLSSLKPDNTVLEAATMMTSANIAALVILDDDAKLVGIVTERDLTRRAIAKGLLPDKTPISDIMTENPDTLAPDDSAGDALELMQARHFRHLPVMDADTCVGMVSIRDLYVASQSTLEENIRETEAFVFGDRYGA